MYECDALQYICTPANIESHENADYIYGLSRNTRVFLFPCTTAEEETTM
jgi:hypothetical protein